jgi:hypothetical protein
MRNTGSAAVKIPVRPGTHQVADDNAEPEQRAFQIQVGNLLAPRRTATDIKVTGQQLNPTHIGRMIKPRELVDIIELTPLNRSETILYNQLLAHAWNNIKTQPVHKVLKASLRGTHDSNDRLHEAFDRLHERLGQDPCPRSADRRDGDVPCPPARRRGQGRRVFLLHLPARPSGRHQPEQGVGDHQVAHHVRPAPNTRSGSTR